MNIQIARDLVDEFLITIIKIDAFDLDEPKELYKYAGEVRLPTNTSVRLPVQNLIHTKQNLNSVKTSARLPYRISFRFPGQLSFYALPLRALEGIVAHIHLYALLLGPDPIIESFIPVYVEDSVTVERVKDAKSDWLCHLNFSFDIRFNTTTVPNISDLQSPDYFQFENPPTLQEIKIRTYRAKPAFSVEEVDTYVEDSEVIIQK
ncbi:hypothetical protein [Nostoc sp. ChiQUE01b]|uniref:hypothetical protein n=1 Tax=Nostoc sp. ChiQUE01b TaxID=3075376 RepID=UPI002AD20BC8|nr:hypothetical protein [Nostoc sp. ChiQUE01b]MDZ8259454.1 hypothetical protein [Nostoc sp. ChiQUE01b]